MLRKAPPSESVNRRFRHIATTIYVAILVLVLWLFGLEWQGFRDAREAQSEFGVLQAALRAMADISAERRPTFIALETAPTASSMPDAATLVARRATNAHLDELAAQLQDGRCRLCVNQLKQFSHITTALTAARQTLDAIGQQPSDSRSPIAIQQAFDGLVSVIPQLSALAATSAMGVVRENADVQTYLLAARLAALLREHSGRLLSQFMPALVSHRALTEEESFEIGRTLGSIDQLRNLLGPTIQGMPPSLQADFDAVNEHFFGEGLSYVDNLRTAASAPGGTRLSALQASDDYRGKIAPIDRFRDDALALAGVSISDSLRWHLIFLIASGLFASLLTGVLLSMMWRFREKIVRPFVEARQLILAIAAGDLSKAIPHDAYAGEIKDMFGALRVLKHHSAERIRLEDERKQLIQELKTMAETDPLTGLLNRRAFESRARVLLSDERDGDPCVALILLDIDHFKRVNDTYGHETGDRTLIKLAVLTRETSRSDDVVARLGGEEFAILPRVRGLSQAHDVAQRLRQKLHHETIVAVDGQTFGITASFGIAFAHRADAPDIAELLRQADALLYKAKANGRDRIETGALA